MTTHFEVSPRAVWRKSSRSNGNGGSNCVEVAVADSSVGVRDSKNPDGPVLQFTPIAWESFVDGAKSGDFNPVH